jgi:hypothetical protein
LNVISFERDDEEHGNFPRQAATGPMLPHQPEVDVFCVHAAKEAMMRKHHVLFTAIAMSGFCATEASALVFDIAGTHGRDVVKSACSMAGGHYTSGAGGYDCMYKSGASMTCDNKGKCTGYTTRAAGDSPHQVTLSSALSKLADSPKTPPPQPNMRSNISGAGSQTLLITRSQPSTGSALSNTAATGTASPLSSSGPLTIGASKAGAGKLR